MLNNLGSRIVLIVITLALSGPSLAATEAMNDPITMLQQVTDKILRALRDNKSKIENHPEKLYGLVDDYILPYVDFNEMSVWIAGRTAWGKASEASREEFIKVFKVLVVRTYASALTTYSNEQVYFAPQKIDTNKDRIQVVSTISRAGRENIRIDYRLVKNGDGWLVYDIIIEGVSILQGFQAQFSDEIRQKGLVQVIAQIKQHNKKLGANV